jgi:diadenosine tetraphosphate (Ap4A) HIT family hydrolase
MKDKCNLCNPKEEYLRLKEYKYWTLYIAESQFILGWTYAALKRHIFFFEELTDEELSELKKVISDIKSALDKTFKPDWFNVMQLGNMTKHIHFQLVPRYKSPRIYDGRTFVDPDWGNMIINRWKPESKEFLTKLANHIKENIQ